VPPLNALAATTATADVDIELADQGTSRDFRLILCGNLGFPDGATALRARVRQGYLKDFIDRRGAGGQAVAVTPVGRAGFATGLLGLWLGRPLGERCGLAFGPALSLVKAGAGLFEFALEAFVLLAKAFVLLAELLDMGAELLQLFKHEEGHGHRVEYLDGRHRCLVTAHRAHHLLCESPAKRTRGRYSSTLGGPWPDSFVSIALASDARSIVSGSNNHVVRVWDRESGKCLHSMKGHGTWVTFIAMTADGAMAVSAETYSGQSRVWDLNKGRCVRTLDTQGSIALTPDGRVLANVSKNKYLCIWDVASGTCVRRIPIPSEENISDAAIALTADGAIAAFSVWGEGPDSFSEWRRIWVWDVVSGACLRGFETYGPALTGLAITPDGRILVSAGNDGFLRTWSVRSGREVRRDFSGSGKINAIALTVDGRMAVFGKGNAIQAWNLESGSTLNPRTQWATNLALSRDGRRLISCCNVYLRESLGYEKRSRFFDRAWVWDAISGEPLLRVADDGLVDGVAISPDGRLGITFQDCSNTRIWDCDTGNCVWEDPYRHSIPETFLLMPDGKTIVRERAASAGEDNDQVDIEGEMIEVWDIVENRCLRSFIGHRPINSHSLSRLIATQDGRTIMSAGHDGMVRIWDICTGECLRVLEGHLGGVCLLASTPDGKRAASAGNDNILRVWDVDSGSCLLLIPCPKVNPRNFLDITPNGKTVIFSTWAAQDRYLSAIDVLSGELLWEKPLKSFLKSAIRLLSDRGWVMAVGYDDALHVWDIASGECVASYHAGSEILALSGLSADNRTVCSTGDGQFHFLQLRNVS
jgi:WD40 repeat protein